MTTIKFCKDCRHMVRENSYEFSKCGRTETLDPVSGETLMTFCSTERKNYIGCCGPNAKFFEAK